MAKKTRKPDIIGAIKVLHSHIMKCFDEINALSVALSEKGILNLEDLEAAHLMIGNSRKIIKPIKPGKGFLHLVSNPSGRKKAEDDGKN
ncbi:hypothetical protein L6267_02095 [Candidatus Parcubacteria bacterium]|nr:hypothetical protein [Candidatus Parcubacteria bacterium]